MAAHSTKNPGALRAHGASKFDLTSQRINFKTSTASPNTQASRIVAYTVTRELLVEDFRHG